jgi:hypothetical protein
MPHQRPCRPRKDRPDDAAAVRRHHQMKDMEEANPEFSRTDVVLVVGANDITNPAARRPGSSVTGMPILNVDEARSVIVIKRSKGHGCAGHRQRAVYRPEDRDVVRRRQGCADRAGRGRGRLRELTPGEHRRSPHTLGTKEDSWSSIAQVTVAAGCLIVQGT